MPSAAPMALMDLGDTGFMLYLAALTISGIVLIVIGSMNKPAQKTLLRVINIGFGVAFVGYAFYLFVFLHDGDTYRVFVYAFVAPVVLIYNAVRNRRTAGSTPG